MYKESLMGYKYYRNVHLKCLFCFLIAWGIKETAECLVCVTGRPRPPLHLACMCVLWWRAAVDVHYIFDDYSVQRRIIDEQLAAMCPYWDYGNIWRELNMERGINVLKCHTAFESEEHDSRFRWKSHAVTVCQTRGTFPLVILPMLPDTRVEVTYAREIPWGDRTISFN